MNPTLLLSLEICFSVDFVKWPATQKRRKAVQATKMVLRLHVIESNWCFVEFPKSMCLETASRVGDLSMGDKYGQLVFFVIFQQRKRMMRGTRDGVVVIG
ncbi:hypothetical protein VNO78_03553 [Psophocarpus tetragonolobus]|uniref:Uncharacterized protein n=1 Tax=Psophocarpus tetragonolobus TaxID=3891 RepID=A0AAN9TDG3_PSOTE